MGNIWACEQCWETEETLPRKQKVRAAELNNQNWKTKMRKSNHNKSSFSDGVDVV